MGKRERLDKLLVERGLVASREEGRGRILAGEVWVNGQPLTKAGTLIDETAAIRVKSALPYVSRGGTKLEKALREFSVDLTGKIALDVGASTGGFTHCMLTHGAAQVFAVDVGYGQLDWKLRNDPRVLVLRKNQHPLPDCFGFTAARRFCNYRCVLHFPSVGSPAGEDSSKNRRPHPRSDQASVRSGKRESRQGWRRPFRTGASARD